MRSWTRLVLLGVAIVGPVAAGEFWQEKDYRRWSEKECRKLLENSPWTKVHTLGRVFIQPLQVDTGAPPTESNPAGADPNVPNPSDPTERARESNPRMAYQVQFRSALPIRQALVRLGQIERKYDEMPGEQQETFDREAERFLAVAFPDTVVVHVAYSSNVALYDRELARHWQSQTTGTLQNFVFLIGPQGDKLPLLRYTHGEGAGRVFQFVFPRQLEGRPLVSPEDKSLKLEFPHPNIRGQGGSRILLDFKLEKMLQEGTVVY